MRTSPYETKTSMAWRCSALTNDGLVDNLVRAGIVQSQRVVLAMKATDRGKYVGTTSPEIAYRDAPQVIGYHQTISAPHMVSKCRCSGVA